jgi:hypothetical protein
VNAIVAHFRRSPPSATPTHEAAGDLPDDSHRGYWLATVDGIVRHRPELTDETCRRSEVVQRDPAVLSWPSRGRRALETRDPWSGEPDMQGNGG